MKTLNIKETIKGVIIIGLYFILPSILYSPLLFLVNKGIINKVIAYLLLYIILTTFFMIIYHKDLIKDFKLFIKDKKNIMKVSYDCWLKGLAAMYISSIIITALNLAPNVNQEANLEILNKYPLLEFAFACILAPIMEELVFRRSLKKATNDTKLYAITTGILFGLIHVTSSLSQGLSMLVYLIPYSALGIAFGFAYSKTNNIYGTIIAHATHNFIALILSLLFGGLV